MQCVVWSCVHGRVGHCRGLFLCLVIRTRWRSTLFTWQIKLKCTFKSFLQSWDCFWSRGCIRSQCIFMHISFSLTKLQWNRNTPIFAASLDWKTKILWLWSMHACFRLQQASLLCQSQWWCTAYVTLNAVLSANDCALCTWTGWWRLYLDHAKKLTAAQIWLHM